MNILGLTIRITKNIKKENGEIFPEHPDSYDFNSLNKYMKGRLLWNIHLIKGYIEELCDWSRQCNDGIFVSVHKFDDCISSIKYLKEKLYKNYNTETEIKCHYCDKKFKGYMAGELSNHHETTDHPEEVKIMCGIVSSVLIGVFNKMFDGIQNQINYRKNDT